MKKYLISLLCLFPLNAYAEWSYPVAWAKTPPVLDGQVNEDVWNTASPIENFYTFGPGVPSRRSIRMLWGEVGLYFAAVIEDKKLLIYGSHHNDTLWKGDVLELFLKPSPKAGGYYEFQVNPHGVRVELYIDSPGTDFKELQKQKPLGMRTAVLKMPYGWQVEGVLPWSVFERSGGKPATGDEWRFTFAFFDYTDPNEAPLLGSSAPLKKPDFHRTAEYEQMRFLAP